MNVAICDRLRPRRFHIVFALCCAVFLTFARLQAAELVSGDATIRGPGEKPIVITTTSRLAGAIHSLTWDGEEFIDSVDHGRQLQSASNFDCGKKFIPEVFNPTEAGSRADHVGDRTTSRLLTLRDGKASLYTQSQMAFWLQPGEKSLGNLAYNESPISSHYLEKRVTIGVAGIAQVIEYDVVFEVPDDEHHTLAQFETLTGYMPPKFAKFYTCDLKNQGKLEPLSDGPGEQTLPIIFSTASGKHAMGVYAIDQPVPGFEHSGYGRFRFAAERVVKWNCVYRIAKKEGISPGKYAFRHYVCVGTLEEVQAAMLKLATELAPPVRRDVREELPKGLEPMIAAPAAVVPTSETPGLIAR